MAGLASDTWKLAKFFREFVIPERPSWHFDYRGARKDGMTYLEWVQMQDKYYDKVFAAGYAAEAAYWQQRDMSLAALRERRQEVLALRATVKRNPYLGTLNGRLSCINRLMLGDVRGIHRDVIRQGLDALTIVWDTAA